MDQQHCGIMQWSLQVNKGLSCRLAVSQVHSGCKKSFGNPAQMPKSSWAGQINSHCFAWGKAFQAWGGLQWSIYMPQSYTESPQCSLPFQTSGLPWENIFSFSPVSVICWVIKQRSVNGSPGSSSLAPCWVVTWSARSGRNTQRFPFCQLFSVSHTLWGSLN